MVNVWAITSLKKAKIRSIWLFLTAKLIKKTDEEASSSVNLQFQRQMVPAPATCAAAAQMWSKRSKFSQEVPTNWKSLILKVQSICLLCRRSWVQISRGINISQLAISETNGSSARNLCCCSSNIVKKDKILPRSTNYLKKSHTKGA